jgi:hypothetical protein
MLGRPEARDLEPMEQEEDEETACPPCPHGN